MAVPWLQSAVYPPTRPKLQAGLTKREVDADYERFESARRRPFDPSGLPYGPSKRLNRNGRPKEV